MNVCVAGVCGVLSGLAGGARRRCDVCEERSGVERLHPAAAAAQRDRETEGETQTQTDSALISFTRSHISRLALRLKPCCWCCRTSP